MCSGPEAGSYLRFIDFVYHSTLGLRVIKKRREESTAQTSQVGRVFDLLPSEYGTYKTVKARFSGKCP